MPRFSRMSRLHPVNRTKHVIDSQQGAIAGTQIDVILIDTVDAPVLATNPQQVLTSSKVNGIFLIVEVYGTTSGALANAYMMVYKRPASAITIPNANAIGTSELKKYVIHQEMVMLQKVTPSNPRTLFKGVIKIPRGYIRNGPLDQLRVAIFSPGVNLDVCIQCHYKEFR